MKISWAGVLDLSVHKIAFIRFLVASIVTVCTIPAEATPKNLGACGTEQQAGEFLAQDGQQIIAYFERYAGKSEDGTDRFLSTFLTAREDGTMWGFLNSDTLYRTESNQTKSNPELCLVQAGGQIEILDYEAYRAAFNNKITMRINGKTDQYSQGIVNWFSRDLARKEWAKHHKRGSTDNKPDNPFIETVLGYHFDFRDAERACRRAKELWASDSCDTYEQKRYDIASLWGVFFALQAEGERKDGIRYILSIAIDPESNRAHLFYSTPDGGTVRLQTGREFRFKGWAAKKFGK